MCKAYVTKNTHLATCGYFYLLSLSSLLGIQGNKWVKSGSEGEGGLSDQVSLLNNRRYPTEILGNVPPFVFKTVPLPSFTAPGT